MKFTEDHTCAVAILLTIHKESQCFFIARCTVTNSLIIYSHLREPDSEPPHLHCDRSCDFPIRYEGMKTARTHSLCNGHYPAKFVLIPHQNTVDWFDKQPQHLETQAVCTQPERR